MKVSDVPVNSFFYSLGFLYYKLNEEENRAKAVFLGEYKFGSKDYYAYFDLSEPVVEFKISRRQGAVKQVIRIEKEKRGFFRPSSKLEGKTIQKIYDRHRYFKLPSQDKIDLRKNNKNWFLGYKNINQVHNWLEPSEIKYLIKRGFEINLYEVIGAQEGTDQIAFTQENVRSVKNITELFKF